MGGTVAAVHFLAWTDNEVRRAWRRALESLRLRPRGG
jgi:hypothetical protein